MDELGFRMWLNNNNVNKKVQGDMVSRLKKIEHSIKNCDIDEQYRRDKCEYLISLFRNKGINDDMEKNCESVLPIGKYSLNTYKCAVRKYVQYMNSELE